MLTAAAFLTVYVAGCLLALVRHPIFGLVTYVGVFYLHPPARWWGAELPSLRWSLIAAGITLLAVMMHHSDDKSPRLFGYSLMRGSLFFLGWLTLQSLWALDQTMHFELLTLTAKYVLLMALIYKCIDSTTHLKYFLWAHAAGCFYLGTIVFTEYAGGRFEGFGGPGISEANSGGLQVATGVVVTFALFLSGKWVEKATAIGFMPFILNALVATLSRSGFLALAVAGVLFNLFVPKEKTKVVRAFSLLGLGLFLVITNPVYWDRIDTILVAGEEIEDEDTGAGRLVLMEAQLRMFVDHPFGCGHRCTATLSPAYLDDVYLTGTEERRARSSHNTFMSFLVEQGIPGVVLYIMLLIWVTRSAVRLREPMRSSSGLLPNTYAATVAILGAIIVGDLFVDYLKFEARVWFLAILMVLDKLDTANQVKVQQDSEPETLPVNRVMKKGAPTRLARKMVVQR
ncbi:MAG: O-antigen ligase family protein [Woeseia sp.]